MAFNPTNFPTPLNSTCKLLLGDGSGYAIVASCTGAAPTTADVFQHGCVMLQTDTSTGTGALYQNIGSIAVPSWSLIDTASSSFTLPVAATDASTTTGNSFALTQNAVTTGKGIVTAVNGLTTGQGLQIASSATAITTTGRLLSVSHTGTTSTSGIIAEIASAATDETIVAQVTASAANALGKALVVSTATTTGQGLNVVANALTTGSAVAIASSSADATARPLVSITNSGAAAVGTTPLAITNAGVQGTGSKFVPLITGTSGAKTVTIWMNIDQTDPNGALTATAGDMMLNSVGGKIAYCSGTNVWVTLTSA